VRGLVITAIGSRRSLAPRHHARAARSSASGFVHHHDSAGRRGEVIGSFTIGVRRVTAALGPEEPLAPIPPIGNKTVKRLFKIVIMQSRMAARP
jgi:hypothetical protein